MYLTIVGTHDLFNFAQWGFKESDARSPHGTDGCQLNKICCPSSPSNPSNHIHSAHTGRKTSTLECSLACNYCRRNTYLCFCHTNSALMQMLQLQTHDVIIISSVDNERVQLHTGLPGRLNAEGIWCTSCCKSSVMPGVQPALDYVSSTRQRGLSFRAMGGEVVHGPGAVM